jgi:hypothetical protein
MSPFREQAIAAFQAGDRNTALELLQKALGENPRDVDAWLYLAQVVKTPEKKRECYRRVLRIQPDNAAALDGLAELDAEAARAKEEIPAAQAQEKLPAARAKEEPRIPSPPAASTAPREMTPAPAAVPARPRRTPRSTVIALMVLAALALTALLLTLAIWLLSGRQPLPIFMPPAEKTAAAPTPLPTQTATLPPALHAGLPGGITPGGWMLRGLKVPAGGGPAPVDTLYLFPDGTFLFLGWGPYELVDARTLRGCGRFQDQGSWKFCFTLRVLSVDGDRAVVDVILDFPTHPESSVHTTSTMQRAIPDTGSGAPEDHLAGSWKILGSQALYANQLELRADGTAATTSDNGTQELGAYSAAGGNLQFSGTKALWWRIHSLGDILFLEGGNQDTGMMMLQRVPPGAASTPQPSAAPN